LLFVLDYAGGNRDPEPVESVTASIRARSGDREVLTVFETGPDTGVRRLHPDRSRSRRPGQRRLPAHASSPATRSPSKACSSGTQTTARGASVDVLVDPFGYGFDSFDAKPGASGTRVTLIDAATGQPAQVFGDDGTSAYPSDDRDRRLGHATAAGTVYSFHRRRISLPARPSRHLPAAGRAGRGLFRALGPHRRPRWPA
jgi:hypothetical protein